LAVGEVKAVGVELLGGVVVGWSEVVKVE